jgi:3',5'-cyclic AMP phosphodiesterase CpdA
MLIAQLSDTHVLPTGALAVGQVDTTAALARWVERIASLRQPPDVVVVTGDLVHNGEEVEYRALRRLLDRLPCPYYPIPGNHDARGAFRATFAALPYAGFADALAYAIEEHPLRILALDSLIEGDSQGELGADQLAWLAEQLAAAPKRPTLVLVHHPPFDTGIGFMDRQGLKDRAELARVIADHPQVERLLCGHQHRAIQARFAGTLAMTAPGASLQIRLDLQPDGPWEWICEPPAILLHRWDGVGGLATHLCYLEEFTPSGSFV